MCSQQQSLYYKPGWYGIYPELVRVDGRDLVTSKFIIFQNKKILQDMSISGVNLMVLAWDLFEA